MFCKSLKNAITYNSIILLGFTLLIFNNTISFADQNVYIGIGAGTAYGINEAEKKNVDFEGRIFGIYHDALDENVALELGISSLQNSSYDFTNLRGNTYYNPFNSIINQYDARARWYFWDLNKFKPYFYTGIGYISFKSYLTNDSSIKSSSLIVPIGAGFEYKINQKWCLNFNIGTYYTGTDNINPVLDGTNDSWWSATLGVTYNLGSIFNTPNEDDEAEEFDLDLGKSIVFPDIVFQIGKSVIPNESLPALRRVLKTLKVNKEYNLVILGHTDSQGNKNSLTNLTSDRAEAIKKWLVSKGIDKSRLTTKAMGYDKPIGSNDTPTGRALNNRIEFQRTK